MDPESGKRQSRHVEGRLLVENPEPAQPDGKVYAGDELHETGHPESTQAHRAVHFRRVLRETKEGLSAPDKVPDSQAKEAGGYGNKNGRGQRNLLRGHDDCLRLVTSSSLVS